MSLIENPETYNDDGKKKITIATAEDRPDIKALVAAIKKVFTGADDIGYYCTSGIVRGEAAKKIVWHIYTDENQIEEFVNKLNGVLAPFGLSRDEIFGGPITGSVITCPCK